MVLDAEPDLEVVAEAGDGVETVQRALKDDIDLLVVDISMPKMTGLQAVHELHRRRPTLRILILSMHQNEQYLYKALKAGASGYVLKTVVDRDLIQACRAGNGRRTVPVPRRDDPVDPRLPSPPAERPASLGRATHRPRAAGRQADRGGPQQ
jgi:DNA-binding NarL/FixJ family response regulator